MKTIVLGLEGVDPARLLGDAGLVHVRALMERGVFGSLDDAHAPGTASPWHTLASGRPSRPGDDDGTPSRPTLWDLLGEGPRPPGPLLVDVPWIARPERSRREARPPDAIAATRGRFSALRFLMASRPWHYAQIVDDAPAGIAVAGGPEAADPRFATFDEELGRLLAQAIDEVTVLIVAVGRPGAIGPGPDPDLGLSGAFVLASSRAVLPEQVGGARLIDLPPTLLAIAGRPIPDAMAGRPLGNPTVDAPPVAEEELVLDRLRGLGYLN